MLLKIMYAYFLVFTLSPNLNSVDTHVEIHRRPWVRQLGCRGGGYGSRGGERRYLMLIDIF